MNELDFTGKRILVVGGSSGIGNGIAQAFRARGARVQVCGTRASAADYRRRKAPTSKGWTTPSSMSAMRRPSRRSAPPFDRLDVLVLARAR